MFRWGIIGLGRIAHKFATELLQNNTGMISAAGSRDLKKAENFVQTYGGQAFGSYQDFIDNGAMDAVYIAVPHPMHAELVQSCLQKKIPVLCEKPFTINSGELKKLIKIARNEQVFLMEAMWSRFMPHIKWVKEQCDFGEWGKILHLKAEFSFKGKDRAIQEGVRRLVENELGGGALLDIGIYPLFLSHLLLGTPSKILANASIENEIDETCQVILAYPTGATAMLDSSILWEAQGKAEIYFEHATIFIPQRWHETNEVIIKQHNGSVYTKKWDYPSRGFVFEIEEVQRCVGHGILESDLMPLDFSLQIMNTMDQIRKQIGLTYAADH